MTGFAGLNVPAQLAFSVQPGNGLAGSALSVQAVVEVQDADGNVATADGSTVTVSIGTNPAGGSLAGAPSQAASAGVADFSTNALGIDKAGTGYTLVATDGALRSATSGVFKIVAAQGPAVRLAFTTQPGGGANHQPWTRQPVVALQDADGITVTGRAQTVTLAIWHNAGGGALAGTVTATVDANTGMAAFDGLSIDNVGAGYTLTAAGNTLSTTPGEVVSRPFDITAGDPVKLVFATQPGGGYRTWIWVTQPVLALLDAYDNPVTGVEQTVTLAIQNNAAGDGVLSGTRTVDINPGTGMAIFTSLSIDKLGTGYTLTAIGNTITPTPGITVSAPFDIVVDPTVVRFLGGSNDGWSQVSTVLGPATWSWPGTVLVVK